jgi:hypothetical protein
LLRRGVGLLLAIFKKPIWGLVMPYQCVTNNKKSMLLSESDKFIGRSKIVLKVWLGQWHLAP